jgi:hypothetical protein
MKQNSTEAASRKLVILALAALLAACGGGGDDGPKVRQRTSAPVDEAAQAAAAAESPDDKRMANAVVTGKTSAPVDLKYDLLAKPAVGQPFEIELAFLPRLATDTLEVEVTGIPGLVVVSGGKARFDGVAAGGRHVAKVTVQADTAGIYYVNVVARMITQVQTEARTFSVPVVVGTVAPAQAAAPVTDAAGEAIEPMPAVEKGGKEGGGQQ